MGTTCTGCVRPPAKRSKKGMEIEDIPQDILDYHSVHNLPLLKFDALLSNIKIANPPKVCFENEVVVVIS